ncbi:thermonuclease family protein [Undibacterium sp. TC4M20W]|uniref:thermonuclease family protein n=1 Tax=Undibacterium sp. TC4M20W TaxID=3413052 RepID=UPI003BF118A7
MQNNLSLLLSALLFLPFPVSAGKVVSILDGDTLELMESGKAIRVRLANIDAPEKSQPYGQASKQSLSDMCYGRDAQLQKQSIDQYGRTVGIVTCGGIEANRVQVERGLAWVYPMYNRDPSLVSLQNSAKQASSGLWRDANPTPPWDYRHGEQSKPTTHAICYTGPRGGRYKLVNGHKQYRC